MARPSAVRTPALVPEGHVALQAPSGATAVSWEGQEFPVIDGLLVIPEAAAEVFASHGFTRKEA